MTFFFTCPSFTASSLLVSSIDTRGRVDTSKFPIELRELIQKVNRLTSFQDLNEGLNWNERRSTRDIEIGSSADGKEKIFIKQHSGKRFRIRQPYARQEQLAFMISQRLSFDVVPATIACSGYKHIFDRMPELVRAHLSNHDDDSYSGVVIQEGVLLHSHQFHEDSHQGKSEEFLLAKALDVDQLCRAIFFNIVAGRCDAGERNTCIEQSKKVMEFDNENIGHNKTNSWLFKRFGDCVLSKHVVDEFLLKDASIINGIFQDLNCFGPTRFWNDETYKFDIEDESRVNILNNFEKLRATLQMFKNKSEIKVSDLRSIFYTDQLLPGYFAPRAF